MNEFIKGQDLYGIEKFNLKGEQNDPSLIRSKIAFDLMEKIGLAGSRVCYTKVYINDDYMGLYEIIEHIDENFASYHFGNNDGNLWKCLYPADLNYRGSSPSDYWPYIDDERPYELKTNKDDYDYSELAHLIDIINNTDSYLLKDSLESILQVTDVIKYLAVNIMTGSWDDYRYLKNNYYLYHDPGAGKFRFIPYDYDNTFGIDWVEGPEWGDPNWARINMYSYAVIDDSGRPLSDIIFNDSEYRNLFTHFIDFYTNHVFREDQWRSYADSIKARIRPDVALDTYYPRDHGFTMTDFDDSYDTDYRNGHVERGLYEFMRKRSETTNEDITWRSEPPSIYHRELHQRGKEATINTSVFHRNGVASVSLKTFDGDYILQSTYPMTRNRISGTTLIEEYDQWSLELTLEDNDIYYVIIADDSLGTQRTWPRHGYAEFDNKSRSDLPLYINEFLASNEAGYTDPAGEHDDWVEIYNASQSAIDLGGMFLTDKPDNLDKWAFPSGTMIDPGGFLLVWCDEDGDKDQAGLHADFKLSAGGEYIALVDIDSISIIDELTFGEQTTDISYGRSYDGGSSWKSFDSPTPGYSNLMTNMEQLIPRTSALNPNYPNPFNPQTTIDFQLSRPGDVDLCIYDLKGNKVSVLLHDTRQSGYHRLQWNAERYASGVYLAILRVNDQLIGSQKMLLIK
jgi:hypothetical protein